MIISLAVGLRGSALAFVRCYWKIIYSRFFVPLNKLRDRWYVLINANYDAQTASSCLIDDSADFDPVLLAKSIAAPAENRNCKQGSAESHNICWDDVLERLLNS
jgi:hypothetical protein